MKKVYKALYKAYGPQRWWPITTKNKRFEVMVGAVLTQNTAWGNVERAIKRLKSLRLVDEAWILQVDSDIVAQAIKSAGYYNQKARSLRVVAEWYKDKKEKIWSCGTSELRSELLALKGVGQETADSILLYAFDRPVFVIDAYARRIFSRLGCLPESASYDEWQNLFISKLKKDARVFNEYHALIVEHAKRFCNKRPKCRKCVLSKMCTYSQK